MTNRDDEFIDRLDTDLLNEQTSDDQIFDSLTKFEVSHSANTIEKLIHLSRFGNLLTLVIGNNGCGKTYLLDKFLASVDESYQVCHIQAQPLISIDQLFQQIIQSFAGEATFTGIPLTANQYEEWAQQLTVIPGNRLLVIDDADVLSSSVLHELCQLSAMQQEKETPHLHLILLGNYDLINSIEQTSKGVLAEDGIYTIDIPSLNDDEATRWVKYLFARDEALLVPDPVVADLVARGQGNLAHLKELVENYEPTDQQVEAYEQNPESQSISLVGYWYGLLTILIMIVVGGFFFQSELMELAGFGEPQQVKQQAVKQPEPMVPEQSAITEPLTEPQPEPEAPEAMSLDEEPATTGTVLDTINQLEQSQDKSAAEDSKTDVAALAGESDKSLENENLSDQTEQETATDAIGEEVTQTIDEASAITIEKATPDTDADGQFTDDEQRLLSEPDTNYVVQIIGLSKESTIKAFIGQHRQPEMLYYRSSLKGKLWYIIVLAGYESKREALDARAALPAELASHGPWVKDIRTVRSEILSAQALVTE